MKMRDLLTQAVDTVEAQAEAIEVLKKQASEAANAPAFSDELLKQTAEKLVESELLNKESSDNLVQSFRDNPEQALLSLQKLASHYGKRESAPKSLGKPAGSIKKSAAATAESTGDLAESDKAWNRDFGNEA